jgi:hypothetical protein
VRVNPWRRRYTRRFTVSCESEDLPAQGDGTKPAIPPGMETRSILKALPFLTLSLASVTAFADEPPGPPPAYAPYAQPAPYAPAYAPTYVAAPAPRPTPDRDGFTIGFGLGVGALKFDHDPIEGDSNVGVSLRAGVALSERLLLQGTLEGTRAEAANHKAVQLNFAGVSATMYVHPRLFVVGGLGYASLESLDENNNVHDRSKDSAAVLLGAGVELLQTRGFALSLEVRGFAAEFDDKPATGVNALLGFQWF